MTGRFSQCDDTCTTNCGHCKGAGRPAAAGRPAPTEGRAPVVVLNADLEPIGLQVPCPSSVIARLGVDQPTRLWCSRLADGHDDHFFEVRWTGPGDLR